MGDIEASAADQRPIPEPSPLTRPYWDSAAEGVLSIQRCTSCRRFTHPPRPECPSCGARDLTFEAVSGAGRLESFSVVHRTFAPGFRDRTPYVIAWVALPEQRGLRLFTNIVDAAPEDLETDAPVEVVFADRPGFGPVPEFRPARAPHP